MRGPQNYVHWSQYGPTYTRNDTVTGTCSRCIVVSATSNCGAQTDINRWTINFSLDAKWARKLTSESIATFTIQLAAAKTTAGNTDANQGA